MKCALPSFQEKKGSMAPCLACGLHKITVAVGFFTLVLVSQNTSRVSRVFRGLLKSTVSKRCCFHLWMLIHSFPSLVLCVLFCVFQLLVPSQRNPRGGSTKTWGWHCCGPVPRASKCPFPYLSRLRLRALSLAGTLALLFTAPGQGADPEEK